MRDLGMPTGKIAGWGFWLEWMTATAAGWAAGEALASFVPEDTVLLGTLHVAVIGLCMGTLQWLTLHQRIDHPRLWVVATSIGSAVGGAAGLAASFATGATVIQPWAVLPLGVALGVAQWLVLRTQLDRAGWWVLVCTLGLPLSFVVGLVVSFSLGFEWEGVDPVFRVVSLAFFGAVAGLVFGLISGALLVLLVRKSTSVAAPVIPALSQISTR
jgi:hypothetical protein